MRDPVPESRTSRRLGEEVHQDRDHERVDGHGFGKCATDDHHRSDRTFGLWVTAECFHGTLDRDADAESWPNGANTDRERRRDSLRGVDPFRTSQPTEHPGSSSRRPTTLSSRPASHEPLAVPCETASTYRSSGDALALLDHP